MYIMDLRKNVGKKVEFLGFVDDVRKLGKLIFLIVEDKTAEVQCVLKKDIIGKKFEDYVNIPMGSYVQIKGKVVKNPEARSGIELMAEEVNLLSESEPYPIDITGKIKTTFEKRLDWRFLDMRRKEVRDVFIFQGNVVQIISEFLEKNNFTRLFFSRITGDATEGGTEYFKIDYFNKKAYLAQSPQLYKEAALLSGLDKVYDLGFVYRAEPHHTTRHLCEYMSLDVEMVARRLEEILDFHEKMMKYLFKNLEKRRKTAEILKSFNISPPVINEIPRITFSNANKILKENNISIEPNDLTTEGEKFLCSYFEKENSQPFVFVTEFPFEEKPFYIMRNGNISLSFDMLFKGLEISSGGLREHRYKERVKNIVEKGLKPEDFDHLRFWKLGMPPHGGFAIGIERLIERILNLGNVRNATLLPRDPGRLKP